MNKLYTIILLILAGILFATDVLAQVPQGFNFQAVARNADGELITESNLGVQISVLKGSEGGSAVYSETHTPSTNAAGSFQVVIGEGDSEDDFQAIEWSNDNYYVKLEIDPAGGTEYEELGTTRLLSVPYAMVSQNVINGISAGEDGITEYHLNSSQGDTSFIVNATGSTSLTAIRGNASTDGVNYGVTGTAKSTATNSNTMYGVYGTAPGDGTGLHLGILGSAINSEATGGSRYGVYGQASAKTKYKYGVHGYSFGDGNGDEGEGYGEGSINFGLRGSAIGNSWNNSGLEAEAYGDAGKVNYGVAGLSHAGSEESVKNHGVAGRAWGPGVNYGVYGSAWDGVENYAGYFDGNTVVNGDLTVNGTINSGEFGSGSTNVTAMNESGDIVGSMSSFEPNKKLGFLHLYGQTETDNTDDLRAALEVNNDESGNSWGHFYLRGPIEDRHLVEASASNDPEGSDPEGWSGRLDLWGTNSPNIVLEGKNWESADTPQILLYGNKPNTDNWFYEHVNLAVNKDGEQEWGALTLLGNDGNINIELGAKHWEEDVNSAGRPFMKFSGNNSDQELVWLEVIKDDFTGEEYGHLRFNSSNGEDELSINAHGIIGNLHVDGDVSYTGTSYQSSDRNLKENIQPLQNGLSTIMKLKPTTYNFRGNGEYKGLKLSTGLHYGLIAQEVEEVLPSLVKDNAHTYTEMENTGSGPDANLEKGVQQTMDYKTMNYTELIPVLIKAVQEQQEEIERLQKEINELKSR